LQAIREVDSGILVFKQGTFIKIVSAPWPGFGNYKYGNRCVRYVGRT